MLPTEKQLIQEGKDMAGGVPSQERLLGMNSGSKASSCQGLRGADQMENPCCLLDDGAPGRLGCSGSACTDRRLKVG